MCYTQKQNFQVGVLHTTHFWQHCDHYWVYCTHVLLKKAPGGLLFTTQQYSTAINHLVAYMHIKIILGTYLNLFSLSLFCIHPTYSSQLYAYTPYLTFMSDFTQLPPPSYHLPTPSNTGPPKSVMHHARIDHHSRSIGRRNFEGGLPLRAALLVQGPIDLVPRRKRHVWPQKMCRSPGTIWGFHQQIHGNLWWIY